MFTSKETVCDHMAWVPSLKRMNFQMIRIIEKCQATSSLEP